MTAVTDQKTHYIDTFAAIHQTSDGITGSWMDTLRKEAIERFAQTGFPTTRDEEWRFTSVAPIARTAFRPGPAGHVAVPGNGDAAAIMVHAALGLSGARLVFVNGILSPELSSTASLPDGVRIEGIGGILDSEKDRLEPYFKSVNGTDGAFAALNMAFMQDGAFVQIPPGCNLEEAIHLVFLTVPDGPPLLSSPRNLVLAGAGSRCTVVESYYGQGTGAYFTNAFTQIAAGENATVEHTKVQRESHEAYHIGNLTARLDRDSRFISHSISVGGSLVRNDLRARLDAEGAECTLNGLFVGTGRQHVDNHTVIDHAMPYGTSREYYKGIMGGTSRGVFDGKIIVRPGAQKSDAKQANKNLLLSDDALVDTKPQLEIYADDVKCNHAATIGRLDEASLFYLRSRGLDRREARSLLIRAFAGEIVERITVDPIRRGLDREISGDPPPVRTGPAPGVPRQRRHDTETPAGDRGDPAFLRERQLEHPQGPPRSLRAGHRGVRACPGHRREVSRRRRTERDHLRPWDHRGDQPRRTNVRAECPRTG
jgi:Fe-S cluster assembly protein SufD